VASESVGFVSIVFVCAACGVPAQANPTLVMSIPARWDGSEYVPDPNGPRQPICENCARQLKQRFENEGLPIPDVVNQPDYFEKAYRQSADEDDL
jgi:hypothetical protein